MIDDVKSNLSIRDAAIVEFLQKHSEEGNYPPTYAEIGEAVGITSKSSVKYRLDHLEEIGIIERAPGRARTTRLSSRWRDPTRRKP